MALKQVRAIPGGTAQAPLLAVNDLDDASLPRIVGWGWLTVVAGAPSWLLQSGYFTNVVDDLGAGDFNLHPVAFDANVWLIGPPNGVGEWIAIEGVPADPHIHVKTYTWTGADVQVDAGTHAGTVTGAPVTVDLTAAALVYVVKTA